MSSQRYAVRIMIADVFPTTARICRVADYFGLMKERIEERLPKESA